MTRDTPERTVMMRNYGNTTLSHLSSRLVLGPNVLFKNHSKFLLEQALILAR